MTVNFSWVYFTLYFTVVSKHTLKLLYLQYGFQDRCLLWVSKGTVKDLFWLKIN